MSCRRSRQSPVTPHRLNETHSMIMKLSKFGARRKLNRWCSWTSHATPGLGCLPDVFLNVFNTSRYLPGHCEVDLLNVPPL